MFTRSVMPLVAERFGAAAEADVLWGTALMVPESSLEEALRTGSPDTTAQAVRWGTRVDEDRIVFSLRGGRPTVLCRLRKESEEQSVLVATWRSPTASSTTRARSSGEVNEFTWPPPLASHR